MVVWGPPCTVVVVVQVVPRHLHAIHHPNPHQVVQYTNMCMAVALVWWVVTLVALLVVMPCPTGTLSVFSRGEILRAPCITLPARRRRLVPSNHQSLFHSHHSSSNNNSPSLIVSSNHQR